MRESAREREEKKNNAPKSPNKPPRGASTLGSGPPIDNVHVTGSPPESVAAITVNKAISKPKLKVFTAPRRSSHVDTTPVCEMMWWFAMALTAGQGPLWSSGGVGVSVPYLHIYPSFTLYTLGDEGVLFVGWLVWSCYVLGPGGSQGYFSNVSRGNVPMGPTKLPNPKSLRPLVVPVQEKERESFHQHCLAKCANTSHLCLARERQHIA